MWRPEQRYSRAERRRLKRLDREVDRVTEGDCKFFARHPHRQHRLRAASLAEIEQLEIVHGRPLPVPPGGQWFAVVKNVAPALRIREFTINNLPGEEAAKAAREDVASPMSRAIAASEDIKRTVRDAVAGRQP